MVAQKRSQINPLNWIRNNFFTILIIIIVILGAGMRLYRIEAFMTFLGDEGRDVLVVKKILMDRDLTFIGPTASVGGFFLGPIYYYFMAPFLLLFNFNPVGPAVMVALVGALTIFLIYILGKKIFNAETGIVAALLYAYSPVVITYSKSSWNPNVVPFFVVLLMIVLYDLYVKPENRKFLYLGLILGIGIQLHYLFSFLFIFIFVNLFFLKKELNFKRLLLIIFGTLLPLTPFILFEFKYGFINSRTLFQFVFASKDTGFSLDVFIKTVLSVWQRIFVSLVFAGNNIGLIFATLSIPFIIFFRKTFTKIQLIIILTWFFVPLFLFGLYKKEIYDYYFGIIFPLPFLLTAYILTKFWNKKIILFLSLLFIGFVVKLEYDHRPFLVGPNHQLEQARTIANFVLEKTEGKPFNFALITGQNSDHAYRYFFEINKKIPVVIENKEIDPQRKSVTDQLLIVCENDCEPLGNSLWEVAGFGRAEVAGSWKVSVVKVYKLVHYKGI